jgi:hypothetical protein
MRNVSVCVQQCGPYVHLKRKNNLVGSGVSGRVIVKCILKQKMCKLVY